MRVDLGLILGIVLEYVFFVFFTNMSFSPKKSFLISDFFALIGYAIQFIVCPLGYLWLNVMLFFMTNALVIYFCFDVTIRSTIINALLLSAISALGEMIVVFFMDIGYDPQSARSISEKESVMITIIGNFMYFIGINLMLAFGKRRNNDQVKPHLYLLSIPLITLICLFIIMKLNIHSVWLSVISLLMVIINIIIFVFEKKISYDNYVINVFKAESERNKADAEMYKIYKEKYEQTKIMQHDFKEQINSLQRLITKKDPETLNHIRSLQETYRDIEFVEYTDNNTLNILLAEKSEECKRKHINIEIYSSYPSFGFMSEPDTISLFSNLLNNAIESCEKSKEKNIYINFYTSNTNYSIVKIENSADIEPYVKDNIIYTQKEDKDMHGIGHISIRNTVKKYKGNIAWRYDPHRNRLGVVVAINALNTE